MRHYCDFCEKDKRKAWRCPDCGTTTCDRCSDKKYNVASVIKAPFAIATLGIVDVKKRVCLKCGSKRLRRI
jgi:hypothetical protein